jgi:hypothetical protein
MEDLWNVTDRGKPEVLGGKPVRVPVCSSQNPDGLTWLRTQASAVRSWRLTALAVARPEKYFTLV